jgi:Cu/Ag efflux pump CusA
VSLTVTPVLCYILLPGAPALEKREPWLLRAFHRTYGPTLEWGLRHRGIVLGTAGLLVALAAAAVPFLGRSFLPPFNEGSLTVGVVSAPGIPLAESDRLGRQVEQALLEFPEVVSTSRRTGRAERDEHVQGVNASEMEVVLGPMEHGRTKEELLGVLRRSVATIPGVTVSFGQPISHRIDHMISGSRTNLAIKVFGPDLAVLRSIAGRVEKMLAGVPDIVDLSNQEQSSIPELVIDFDRNAMARHGLTPASLAATVEAMFQGVEVGEVAEEGITSSLVVRLPEDLRERRERLGDLPVTTPAGDVLRLAQVANVRFDLGPSLIRREDVQRVAMLTANIASADLGGAVERVREAVAAIDLPTGYFVTFGGQFEEAARSIRNLAVLGALILAGMYGLLFVAFRSHRDTLIVLVNLPLALIGGVFAVALGKGVLSVATLVGFVTLFGIATRNGVLLVNRYQDLIAVEGLPVGEAVRRGSYERLAPVLMTALTAGLALIPLVLRGTEPGNEIQSPMAQVILGGLLTSTFLNLVVVPALYERWGGSAARRG